MSSHHLARTLRATLLTSLGLLPLACGGSSEGGKPGEGGKPTCGSPKTDANGVVACAEGYDYRTNANSCGAPPSPDQHDLPRLDGLTIDCLQDETVCERYLYGTCKHYGMENGSGGFEDGSGEGAICESGCYIDSDCGPSGHCRCDGGASVGTCEYGNGCQSDAECQAGFHCASTPAGCGSSGYSCQTAEDTCFGQADCGDQYCVDNGYGRRACGGGSVCGRPFLVQSEQRLPQVTTRLDWQEALTPNVAGLSSGELRAAAEHWARMGQMEHASIAAFARFSLQLLALGAPAELVEACTAALADETAHAKLCFGLASAYAGHAVGPGPLDVSRSLEVTSLVDIVDLVIAEGCVGETAATLEALNAEATATDPVVRAVYRQIARDEQRHAELAFRFVRWALQRDLGAVAPRIEAALQKPLRERSVVVPCLTALLQGAA